MARKKQEVIIRVIDTYKEQDEEKRIQAIRKIIVNAIINQLELERANVNINKE